MFNLNSYITYHKKRINGALESLLKTAEKPDRILEAMAYSLMAGGKRIRPVLCVAAAEAVGGNPEEAVPAACALVISTLVMAVGVGLAREDGGTVSRDTALPPSGEDA